MPKQSKTKLNVKDFGAVGDGVQDDTAAINRTVAACNERGIRFVYLPRGCYVTSPAEPTSDARLDASSKEELED